MKPTLDEMKLAVAKMLPDQLVIKDGQVYRHTDMTNLSGKPVLIRVLDSEWLYVAWLVEQLLSDDEAGRYDTILDRIVTMRQPPKKEPYIWNASADDKLLALCRVKCPEIFIKE